MMRSPTGTKLKAQFFEAFASRTRPDPDRILRPDASYEAARVRDILATLTSSELGPYELRTDVEGHLSSLSPEAFLYFLPPFMSVSLEYANSVDIFSSELIAELTEPSRTDTIEALDRLEAMPPNVGLSEDTLALLRKQQLELADSGMPTQIFHERFDDLTHEEGAAVLAFLEAFQREQGEDFPFGEIETAIERHWARYR